MASITKCRGRWQTRVTTPDSELKKTFDTRKEAIAWGVNKYQYEARNGQLTEWPNCY